MGILTYECLTGTTPFVAGDPMEGYRKIIKCRVPWPSSFTPNAKDFMDKLIVVDPARRMGANKAGPAGVKEHPWLLDVNWKALEGKKTPRRTCQRSRARSTTPTSTRTRTRAFKTTRTRTSPRRCSTSSPTSGSGSEVGKDSLR